MVGAIWHSIGGILDLKGGASQEITYSLDRLQAGFEMLGWGPGGSDMCRIKVGWQSDLTN